MESGVSALVTAAATLCEAEPPVEIRSKQVCDSRKVSDHHAIVPTRSAAVKGLSSLTPEERRILLLVCRRLLQAVSGPYRYAETVVEAECVGHNFSAKGRETLGKGWKIYAEDVSETLLPEGLREGQRMPVDMATVKEGQTSPPKRYTEGTLLAAMETAGAVVTNSSSRVTSPSATARAIPFPTASSFR